MIGPALPPGHCLHPGHLVSGELVTKCPDSAVQGCTTPRMCRSTLSSAPSGVSSRTVSSPDPGTPTIWGRCSSTAPLQVMRVTLASLVSPLSRVCVEPPAVVVAVALAGDGVDLLVLPLVAGQGPLHVPLPRLGPVHRTHRWPPLGPLVTLSNSACRTHHTMAVWSTSN